MTSRRSRLLSAALVACASLALFPPAPASSPAAAAVDGRFERLSALVTENW